MRKSAISTLCYVFRFEFHSVSSIYSKRYCESSDIRRACNTIVICDVRRGEKKREFFETSLRFEDYGGLIRPVQSLSYGTCF